MIRSKTILFLLSISIIGVLKTFAQDSLTLPMAINQALKKSLDITIAKNNIEAATILNSKGFAGGLPVVTGNITDNESVTSVNQKLNTGTTIQRNNAPANALNANITGSILLFNGGRVTATKQRLATLQNQSGKILNSQIQNIIAGVSVAYYDVVRQQNYIKTIDKSIEASNQQLTIVKARQSAGLANNADLFQAQIDLNALQQTKIAQQLIVAQSKTELLRLLTAKIDSTVQIADTIIVENNLTLQSVLDKLSANADVAAADDQIAINKLIVKETNALRYPSVRANAGYNFFRNQSAAGQLLLNQNFGPTVGVSLAIPIFNGNIFKKQAQVATINVANATLQKDIILRDYRAQVTNQYQAYIATISQFENEKETYRLSGQLLDVVLQRFQLRQATIIDVKNAQKSFEESGFRLVNLSFVAKSSEIELKRLSNQLSL
ncbi:MAG: TolC family protein [Ferruginibacter sp.]